MHGIANKTIWIVWCLWSIRMYRIKVGLIYSKNILFRCGIVSISRWTTPPHSIPFISPFGPSNIFHQTHRENFIDCCVKCFVPFAEMEREPCKLMSFVAQTFMHVVTYIFASVAIWHCHDKQCTVCQCMLCADHQISASVYGKSFRNENARTNINGIFGLICPAKLQFRIIPINLFVLVYCVRANVKLSI